MMAGRYKMGISNPEPVNQDTATTVHQNGAVAQLVERCIRTAEVGSSTLLRSISQKQSTRRPEHPCSGRRVLLFLIHKPYLPGLVIIPPPMGLPTVTTDGLPSRTGMATVDGS